jgi:hypothetical protein
MKKIFLLLIIIPVLLTGCFKELPLQEVRACNSSDDCIIVNGGGCCKCDISINKGYEDYWEIKLEQPVDCHNVVCNPCYGGEQEAVCMNNQCSAKAVEIIEEPEIEICLFREAQLLFETHYWKRLDWVAPREFHLC